MCSLAVALELRGRTAATVDELAAVPAAGGLAGAEARRRLVDASLLADVPGVAAFPLKTLQEGLCADAILRSEDPVAALRHVAVASVAGRDRLRDDVEFTLDLVFEHADRAVRRELRSLDSLRWARTVITRGDLDGAREAFSEIWRWHDQHELGFGGTGSGLRTTGGAIAAIASRWPAVILERRDELESEAASGSAPGRLRALAVLGALTPDERTAGWLLPRIDDSDPHIVTLAAQLAGRLRVADAAPALRRLLDSPEEHVWKAALRALVDNVDCGPRRDRGVGINPKRSRARCRAADRAVGSRHGTRAAVRASNVDGSLPWILQRLIETAHPDAWNPRRVTTLDEGPQADGRRTAPRSRAARWHLRAPSRGRDRRRAHSADPGRSLGTRRTAAAAEPYRSSVPRGRPVRCTSPGDRSCLDEERERQERAGRHERHLQHVRALLDERGLALAPADLDAPYGSLRTLASRYREMLGELVQRWWPPTGLTTANDEHRLSEDTRIMLLVGSEIVAPLTAEQWLELLDAHLGARRFGEHEISNDGVTAWLRATYTGQYEQDVADRISTASDATPVGRLMFIAAGDELARGPMEVLVERLKTLDSESPGWLGAVGVMIEGGLIEQARELLKTDISEPPPSAFSSCWPVEVTPVLRYRSWATSRN